MNKFYLFVACFFLSNYLHAQPDLSLRLEKGATYCILTNITSTITKTVDRVDQQTIDNERVGFCYKIIEDYDSIFLAETVFTYMGQDLQMPEGNKSFDSEMPNEEVTSKLLSRLINKPFQVWLRNDFTWIKTKGLDSMVLHMSDDFTLPETTKRYLDSILIESVKDFTRNDANLTAVLYSKNKIIPGQVWTTSTTAEHVIPTNDSLTYSLSETDGEHFTLTGTGTVESTYDQTNDGIEITAYDMSGTTEVKVVYFKTDCWIKHATLHTNLKGDAYIKDIQTGKLRIEPMQIKIEATIEGYKLD